MGTSELKDSFNAAASPAYVATTAFMHYERAHDTEWQILTIRGTNSAGSAFEAVSDPLAPNTDLNLTAKAMGQTLVNQGNTPT